MNINTIKIQNSYFDKDSKPLNTPCPAFKARGVFPGCFDPITNGHIDIIKRAAAILDYLTILVSKNPAKEKSFLSVNNRIMLINKILKDEKLENVQVASTVDYAVKFAETDKSTVIVRGLRNGNDFEYEMKMQKISNELNPNIDIMLLPTKPNLSTISSTEIRNLFEKNADISQLVPKCVLDFLANLKK